MLAMAGATVGFGTLLATNAFTPMAGVGMLALAGAYLGGNYFIAKKDSKTLGIEAEKLVHTHDHGDDHHHHDHDHKPIPVWQSVLWTTAGLGSLVYAAHLAVDGAARFATGAGISEAVVGTLAVALGTSLPELTTSVRAAQRGNTSLAVGNVLGCNIFNILFIGGALAAASTAVPAAFGVGTTMGLFNLAALGTSAALMTATLTANKGGIKKWQGYAALGIYGAYCATNIALGGGALPVTEPAAVHQTVQVEKTPQT
ncbi:MAG: hypothetical protein KJ667_04505 [Alphaproteobacteria bacterium]|nr:hypothetical protein [Alphaproteobacteria bacterium]